MKQNHPLMVMTEAKQAGEDILSPVRRRWMILFLMLVAASAILLTKGPVESTPIIEVRDSWVVRATIEAEDIPNIQKPAMLPEDPYAKYAGQVVPHPRRNPDALVVIKISRYDPQLGGTNCFRWGNGTCLSNMSNGEDWRVNYEIALACDQSWPYYTVVEIAGQLWWCKDHGGGIVESRPGVYWVDQLSKTGHYPHGFEMATDRPPVNTNPTTACRQRPRMKHPHSPAPAAPA